MTILLKVDMYDSPYNPQQILNNYGQSTYDRLVADPAHKWRMDTGIELLHKEPSLEEQMRIYRNWQLMTKKQKELSDQKSLELFGKTNLDNHKSLLEKHATGGIGKPGSDITSVNSIGSNSSGNIGGAVKPPTMQSSQNTVGGVPPLNGNASNGVVGGINNNPTQHNIFAGSPIPRPQQPQPYSPMPTAPQPLAQPTPQPTPVNQQLTHQQWESERINRKRELEQRANDPSLSAQERYQARIQSMQPGRQWNSDGTAKNPAPAPVQYNGSYYPSEQVAQEHNYGIPQTPEQINQQRRDSLASKYLNQPTSRSMFSVNRTNYDNERDLELATLNTMDRMHMPEAERQQRIQAANQQWSQARQQDIAAREQAFKDDPTSYLGVAGGLGQTAWGAANNATSSIAMLPYHGLTYAMSPEGTKWNDLEPTNWEQYSRDQTAQGREWTGDAMGGGEYGDALGKDLADVTNVGVNVAMPLVPGAGLAKGGLRAINAAGKIDDVVDAGTGMRQLTELAPGTRTGPVNPNSVEGLQKLVPDNILDDMPAVSEQTGGVRNITEDGWAGESGTWVQSPASPQLLQYLPTPMTPNVIQRYVPSRRMSPGSFEDRFSRAVADGKTDDAYAMFDRYGTQVIGDQQSIIDNAQKQMDTFNAAIDKDQSAFDLAKAQYDDAMRQSAGGKYDFSVAGNGIAGKPDIGTLRNTMNNAERALNQTKSMNNVKPLEKSIAEANDHINLLQDLGIRGHLADKTKGVTKPIDTDGYLNWLNNSVNTDVKALDTSAGKGIEKFKDAFDPNKYYDFRVKSTAESGGRSRNSSNQRFIAPLHEQVKDILNNSLRKRTEVFDKTIKDTRRLTPDNLTDVISEPSMTRVDAPNISGLFDYGRDNIPGFEGLPKDIVTLIDHQYADNAYGGATHTINGRTAPGASAVMGANTTTGINPFDRYFRAAPHEFDHINAAFRALKDNQKNKTMQTGPRFIVGNKNNPIPLNSSDHDRLMLEFHANAKTYEDLPKWLNYKDHPLDKQEVLDEIGNNSMPSYFGPKTKRITGTRQELHSKSKNEILDQWERMKALEQQYSQHPFQDSMNHYHDTMQNLYDHK